MSKNDKNIDAYSKALLDKKTEYNDELKKPKEVHQMSEAERRQAEKTMSSALDMLRKERGQKTIAEEEQFYQEHKDDLKDIDSIDYDGEFMRILEITKEYGQKYDKEIPVIAAGGISTSSDVKKYINMGAAGVQVGTLFVATEECDANITFKNTYIKCKKEDIKIVKSPVGLPGRAIYNKFLEKLESNKPKIKKCYNCMETCNPSSTPYCISQALINAVNGDIDNALLFCGAEAYKINKIKTVKKVIDELISEI